MHKKNLLIIKLYILSLLCFPLVQAKTPLYLWTDLESDRAVRGSLELIHCLFLKGDISIEIEEIETKTKERKRAISYPLLLLKEKNNEIKSLLYGKKGEKDILFKERFLSSQLKQKLCARTIASLKEKENTPFALETNIKKQDKKGLFQNKNIWITAAILGALALFLQSKNKDIRYKVQGAHIRKD